LREDVHGSLDGISVEQSRKRIEDSLILRERTDPRVQPAPDAGLIRLGFLLPAVGHTPDRSGYVAHGRVTLAPYRGECLGIPTGALLGR
jgi:hypothetical protein